MNIASIDIGSNTVLLLIASIGNGILEPLHNDYKTPRLGKDLIIGGKILYDRINDLLLILKGYKEIIEKYDCEKILISATNAMRIASNSEEIVSKVHKELELVIEIIDGPEEAKRSFLGASSAFPKMEDKIVIDIGGGSTEIIYGNNSDVIYKHSFQVGTVSLTEKFLNNYPYDPNSNDKINDYLLVIFEQLKENIPNAAPVIAVAGTPTTLSCMNQKLSIYDKPKVEGSILTLNDLNMLSNTLYNLSPEQILKNYGQVVSGREDVIFAGSVILRTIIELSSNDRINISSRGLRYGSIINYLDDLK